MKEDPNAEQQAEQTTPAPIEEPKLDWSVRDAAIRSLTTEQGRLQNLLIETERQLRLVKYAMNLQPGRIVATKNPRRQVRVLGVESSSTGLGVRIRVQDGNDEKMIDVSELDPG